MGKKGYDNSHYHAVVRQHFKLRWSRCDSRQSVYGEPYLVWSDGYNLERIREVKKVLDGPKGEAMQYTKEVRKCLRDKACDPSLQELKVYVDDMLEGALEEGPQKNKWIW